MSAFFLLKTKAFLFNIELNMETVVINNLYRLLLLLAALILLLLLGNNFLVYQRKFKDYVSLMILSTVVVCLFELIWAYSDGNLALAPLIYLGAEGYVIFLLIFASIFNRYFLQEYGLLPKKSWARALIYGVPNLVFFVLALSTPWTGLLFQLNEDGFLQEGILFQTLFYILVFSYLLVAIFPAVYHAIKAKGKDRLSNLLIGFAVIGPFVFLIECLVLGFDSDYLALSLPLAIALTFLLSNLNTHLLVLSEAKNKAVEADLQIASKIQSDALPKDDPALAAKYGISLHAAMKTAKEVGGDFYDFFPLDEKRICFLIADVSGKGTPASLFMMTAKTMIKDYGLVYGDTAKIFAAVNDRLSENNDQKMFVTSWIAIFDKETGVLQYTNAGHNPPIHLSANKGATMLKKVHGLVLGAMAHIPYQSDVMKLQKGDRLLLYTDGVVEAHDLKDELYGDKKLLDLVGKTSDKTGEEVVDAIFQSIEEFASGAPQFDDITMVSVSVNPE